jgi:heptosyltransferase II
MTTPSVGAAPRAVLFVKLGALGDVALASAATEAIKARDASTRVTWLCGRRVEDLVRLLPSVDEVVVADDGALFGTARAARAGAVWRIARALRARRFDDIVIAHSDARYRLVTMGVRGPRRQFATHGARPLPVRGRWFADEYARLALDTPDVGPRPRTAEMSDLRAHVPPAAAVLPALGDEPYVVLVPGGARNALRDTPQRRWPIERYVAVARALRESGARVVLLGDTDDRAVLPAFAGVAVVDALGALRIPQSLGVLASAAAVVSHDTGPMHLARLVRAPVVALFGPTSPADFIREDDRTVVLWGGAGLACRPCYDGRDVAPCRDNLCMQDIAVDRVVSAVTSRLAAVSVA